MTVKARIADDPFKGRKSEIAFAQRIVPVKFLPQYPLGIIEVHAPQIFEADF